MEEGLTMRHLTGDKYEVSLGGCKAIIEFHHGYVEVKVITSENKRKGEARQLLLKLKDRYGHVETESCIDSSIAAEGAQGAEPFWQAMLNEGVVRLVGTMEGRTLRSKHE
jgi:hypothetical protein